MISGFTRTVVLAAMIAVAGWARPALANGISLGAPSVSTGLGSGSTAPLEDNRMVQDDDIECQDEDLRIVLKKEQAEVLVSYIYFNHGAEKTIRCRGQDRLYLRLP